MSYRNILSAFFLLGLFGLPRIGLGFEFDPNLQQPRFIESEADLVMLASRLPAGWSAGLTHEQAFGVRMSLDGETAGALDTAPVAPGGKDWPGLRRDTYYFLGVQFAIIGALYVLPESVSAWTEEQKEDYSLQKWWDNIRDPVWDKDEWYINYLLHPYWGSTYYIRGRERGFGRMDSFWYSVFLSALYEFGAEALFEKPSIQDLIVTPVGGTLIGFYFDDVRAGIKAKPGKPGLGDQTVLVLTDPLGAISGGLDSLFGIDQNRSQLRLKAFSSTALPANFGGYRAFNDDYRTPLQAGGEVNLGLELSVAF